MDAMTFTAGQLAARPVLAAPKNGSKAGVMRQALRDNGRQTSHELAAVAGLTSSGLVGALLKNDLHAGRVLHAEGYYSWNFDHEPTAPRQRPLQAGQEVITWRAVGEQLPDADLTVLVRTRNSDEPVWLGYLDGEEWRDVEGLEIDVTHWAEMPKGGA